MTPLNGDASPRRSRKLLPVGERQAINHWNGPWRTPNSQEWSLESEIDIEDFNQQHREVVDAVNNDGGKAVNNDGGKNSRCSVIQFSGAFFSLETASDNRCGVPNRSRIAALD